MAGYVLALDQGTTSSRALLFGPNMTVVANAQQELTQHFPAEGWVEHDPEEIWRTTFETAGQTLARTGLSASDVAAIGIANQRETTVVWDRRTGRAIHRAIVWQDRRTTSECARLSSSGLDALVRERTGLLLDPYFSATKIAWLLDTIPGARRDAASGHLAFGTIDSFLLWRLTGGRVHATDATNASRTMLFDIQRGAWDEELLKAFRIPAAILPAVCDNSGHLGDTDPALFGGSIAIRGMAGDQQAATVGQACFSPGMMKSTYGTGCFALLNTGDTPVASHNRLLTTIAYQLEGRRTYALEGSIFVAGAAVQWLRDGLRIIGSAAETGPLALAADTSQDVVMVPAFVGLGAPYWNPEARGAIFGLTRATGPAEIARATLMSVAFQTRDLIEAMRKDWPGQGNTVIRVDGGMVASDWLMQALADTVDAPVERPQLLETTALGAAWLAGHSAGVWPDQTGFARSLAVERRFSPALPDDERQRRYAAWQRAVAAVIGFAQR